MNVRDLIANNDNLEETLMENGAKFYKACLNKLTLLNRKGKQPYTRFEEPAHASPAKTRQCSENHGEVSICFFCGISYGYLMSVSSTECDLSVRAWATDLEDFDTYKW